MGWERKGVGPNIRNISYIISLCEVRWEGSELYGMALLNTVESSLT